MSPRATRRGPVPLLAALTAGALLAGCGTTVPSGAASTSSLDQGLTGAGPGTDPPTGAAASGPGAPAQQSLTGGATGRGAPASSGPGRGVGSSSEPPGAPGAAPTSLSPTGPGWDTTSVYVGVPTQEDLGAYLGALGISFDPGSIQADVRAIAADVNARGGVLGRRLVPVFHDNRTTDVSGNPSGTAQENCSAFTQDRKVIAVLNGIAPIEGESFLQCMKAARTPLLSMGYSVYDDDVFRRYGPHLRTTLVPGVSRFVPSYVTALSRAGYFGGWDAATATAASTPAVVGLLEPDTAMGRKVAALLETAMQRAGVEVGATYFYKEDASSYGADMSAAILRFRNAGVTHMIDITNVAAAVLIFAQTAQQQRYFPRYGMTSWLLPDTAAQTFRDSGISQQLHGAIGVGWTPGGDVDVEHDPGETAPQRACRQVMAKAGLDYSGQQKRFALHTAWVLCDAIGLLVAAAERGGGLSPESLARGMGAGAPLVPAVTFSNGLSASSPSLPAAYREIHYDTGCTCFVYRGPTRPI